MTALIKLSGQWLYDKVTQKPNGYLRTELGMVSGLVHQLSGQCLYDEVTQKPDGYL